MRNEIQRIHETSMSILEKVGIKVHDPQICRLLRKNGVKVDRDIACFTENQVLSWVRKAPSQFTLHARNPAYNAVIGGARPQYAAGYGCAEIIDAAGRRRLADLQDYVRFVQLVQQSEGFNINGGILVQPRELSASQTHTAMTYATLLYSDKCLMGQPGDTRAVEKIMTMAAMVFGGRRALLEKPRVLTLVNSLSPLQFDRTALETIKVHAEYGQALLIAAGVMSGTTAPITLAGSLALATAEALAGIAICQILREGNPVVMGLVVAPADMATGAVRLGVPSHTVSFKYVRALADFYGLPCRCGGCISDAEELSPQAGYEAMLNMLATRLCNIDLIIHSAGILDSFKAMSFEKFVADLEIIRIVERYLAEITVDEESLALAVIGAVGPGGQFLTSSHTLAHCRDVPYTSMLKKNPQPGKPLCGQGEYIARLTATLEKKLADYRPPDLGSALQTDLGSCLTADGLQGGQLRNIRSALAGPRR